MSQTIFGEDISRMGVRDLFARKNDPACREALVEHYLPSVQKMAEKTTETIEEQEELYSYLCEVLLDSIEKWNDTEEERLKYSHFATFLSLKMTAFIKNNWKTYLADEARKSEAEYYTKPPCIEDAEEELDRLRAVGHGLKYLSTRGTNGRYITVILARYYGQLTLDETARIIGITRERIRQIERKSLRILRSEFARKKWRARDYI